MGIDPKKITRESIESASSNMERNPKRVIDGFLITCYAYGGIKNLYSEHRTLADNLGFIAHMRVQNERLDEMRIERIKARFKEMGRELTQEHLDRIVTSGLMLHRVSQLVALVDKFEELTDKRVLSADMFEKYLGKNRISVYSILDKFKYESVTGDRLSPAKRQKHYGKEIYEKLDKAPPEHYKETTFFIILYMAILGLSGYYILSAILASFLKSQYDLSRGIEKSDHFSDIRLREGKNGANKSKFF